jgi:PAS domain-containing protein
MLWTGVCRLSPISVYNAVTLQGHSMSREKHNTSDVSIGCTRILNACDEGILLAETNGSITFVNQSFLRIAERNHGDIIGGQLFESIPLPAFDIFDFESADTVEESISKLKKKAARLRFKSSALWMFH